MSLIFDIVCDFDEFEALEKAEGDPPEAEVMCMRGWASTPYKDADDERVVQEGLDCSGLLKSGWINWNHDQSKIIGIPSIAEIRDRPGMGKGLYTEFNLIKGVPQAHEVWQLSKALRGTNRRLGLSLEGKRLEVDKHGVIRKARVLNIAVCPNPKNSDATVEALVKAIVSSEQGADARFAPKDVLPEAMLERIGNVVATVMAKALDAGTDVGGATQRGGAALRREELEGTKKEDYVVTTSRDWEKVKELPDGALRRIGSALSGIADARDGRLTKAEAALLTFLCTDATLPRCFEVFGI